jgi:NUDIX domain
MSGRGRSAFSSLLDLAWRTAFRLGFPPARIWWWLARPRHEGAVVAVYVGPALLLVRSSYRVGWHLPGGGVRRGEMPEAAARRELAEEIGLAARRYSLRVLLAAFGTDDATGYISLSYDWSSCPSCRYSRSRCRSRTHNCGSRWPAPARSNSGRLKEKIAGLRRQMQALKVM